MNDLKFAQVAFVSILCVLFAKALRLGDLVIIIITTVASILAGIVVCRKK